MAICPGKVLVISSCRGFNSNGYSDYRNPFNVYLNDVYIGDLIAGNGPKGEGFIGTLNGGVSIPPTHPLCDGEVGDFALSDTYRFDDSIINVGLNIIDLIGIEPIYNSGAGGLFTFILYELSGTSLVNPITIHPSVGWACGGGGDQQVRFQFACPDSPPPIFTTTTTPGPNPPSPLTAYPCVCCCVEDDYVKLLPEKLIFTIPTTIISDNYSLSSVYIEDVTPLSYSIMTTTIIPTTTIQPSYTTIIPITTYIPKQCKCGEVGCNALKF